MKNKGMIFLAIFFPVAFIIEFILFHHIGWVKYPLAVMVLASAILFATEKEDPVEPSKFLFDLALGLLPCIAMLIIYSNIKYSGL